MKIKRLILPLVIVAAALGGWWYWSAHKDGNGELKLSGNIEFTTVDLSFKYPGKLVELDVDEGDSVKKSLVLARLDRLENEHQLGREEASVASALSNLTQLKTAIDYQSAEIAGDVALKTAQLQQAEAKLTELLNGSRTEEIGQARAEREEAKAQDVQAAADWERAQRLFKNDDISAQQSDQFRKNRDAAAAALRRAEENLKLVQTGPRQEDIDQQKAAVAGARAALKLSEAQRIDLQRHIEEIGFRKSEIARAQKSADVQDVELADRILYAPFDGLVLTKSAEIGEVLAAGAAVVTVGDIDHPWVRAYVAEQDLGRIHNGMAASVATDSFPGKTYKGKISFIASDAEFTPKTIQTQEERTKLVYRIKVECENPNRELKNNMPADVTIRIE
ncbi:MAG: HlyD family efflux transporter periplasmic adaptor subunit [Bryobacteraceae bacterium]